MNIIRWHSVFMTIMLMITVLESSPIGEHLHLNFLRTHCLIRITIKGESTKCYQI